MPNIDDVLKSLRGFIDLCRQHPFVSVPLIAVALILGCASAVKLFREQLAWGVDVLRKGTRRQRSILVVVLIGLCCIAMLSPAVVAHYYRPRPVFLDQAPVILTREFNARWQYSEDHNGNVKYHLIAESGEQREEFVTTIPYHKVSLTGRVTLQVTAINSDGVKRSSDPVTLEIYRDSIQRLKSKGQLLIGIHADDNPGVFCFNSPEGGYQGFDIDLSREIARRLAEKYQIPFAEPKFLFYHWPELLLGPASGDVDYVIASISSTPARRDQYAMRFSRPYYTTRVGFIKRKGPTVQKITYSELLKLTVAANSTTTASNFVDSLKLPHVKKAGTKQDVFALLADGKVDGIIYDYVRSISEAKARGWTSVEVDYSTIPPNLRPASEQYSIGLSTVNDALLNDIDEILAHLDTTGMINRRIAQIAAAH